MEKELYQWQEECLERWFANQGRGMVQAVTGAGKTWLALAAAHRLEKSLGQELLVKIVVPTGALMYQWNRALKEYFAVSQDTAFPYMESAGVETAGMETVGVETVGVKSAGMRGNGHKDSPDRPYMIYVVNSARYELARQILSDLERGAAVFLIADECHRYASEQNQLIFEFLPHIHSWEDSFFSLGLSATLPSGQAGEYLSGVLGKRIFSYGIKRASAAKTICQYDAFHIELSLRDVEREEYEELSERMVTVFGGLVKRNPLLAKMNLRERFEELRRIAGEKDRKAAQEASLYMGLAYKRKNLVCMASARVECAVTLIQRLSEGEKILVFGERISQAEELYSRLQGCYPGRVGRYHSKMGRQANRNALERFRDGDLRILISCRAMDEGVDIPDASVGIILSGTSVQRQRVQRLGRILRNSDGKGRASLYYLHVAETMEDSCFLPEADVGRVFDLEYCEERNGFYQEAYSMAADLLLERLGTAGTPEDVLREFSRCLCQGIVRGDWMLEPGLIDEKLAKAQAVRDKNYWICMKRLKGCLSML